MCSYTVAVVVNVEVADGGNDCELEVCRVASRERADCARCCLCVKTSDVDRLSFPSTVGILNFYKCASLFIARPSEQQQVRTQTQAKVSTTIHTYILHT